MDTIQQKIGSLLGKANQLEAEAQGLRTQLSKMSLGGHQDDISISIRVGGETINVAVSSNGGSKAGYSSVLIRGREMILLGAKKAVHERIVQLESEIQSINRHIQRLVLEL